MNLAALAGLILPSPLQLARRATGPNRFARPLDAQAGIMSRNTLRGGLSGQSGSESDYQLEQGQGSAALGAPLEQFIPSARRPYSATHPHLPASGVGQGTGPYVGPFKGWVVIRGRRTWGASSRARSPHVIGTTLLSPTERTPLPRDMASATAQARAGHLRLQDFFGD